MATSKGGSAVRTYMQGLPDEIRAKILRGAARAGGKVIADEAQARANSPEVAKDIVMKTKVQGDRISVLVTVKPGYSYSLAVWEEYGTAQHFISVDDSQRGGMSVRRINEAHRAGSLVIGGKFVGTTVLHPGARAHPFLRPALDVKERDAVAAAQAYIDARVRRGAISQDSAEDDEA